MKVDRRYILSDYETRVEGDTAVIAGYAAVYNARADIGWFVEQFEPHAFKRFVADPKADVRALKNHDPNFVIGRTLNGTLKLASDERGLHYEAIGNMQKPSVRELVADLERGDIDQSSVGFFVMDGGDSWSHTENTNLPFRSITEAGLYDVSPVTFPAYVDTTSGVDQERALRSIAQQIDPDGAGFLDKYRTEFSNADQLEQYLIRSDATETSNSSPNQQQPQPPAESASQNTAPLEAKRKLLEWQRLAKPAR